MFDDSLEFLTYNEFFKRRCAIKKKFRNMDSEKKRIYRMYLYAQREMSNTKVDLIWEYLNEPDSSVLCPTTEQLEQYFVEALEHNEKYDNYLSESEEFEY